MEPILKLQAMHQAETLHWPPEEPLTVILRQGEGVIAIDPWAGQDLSLEDKAPVTREGFPSPWPWQASKRTHGGPW